MGFFSQLIGNASEADVTELEKDMQSQLGDTEKVVAAYSNFRDKWILTDRRLIVVDVTGITGKQKRYTSYGYRHITQVEVLTASLLGTDHVIKLWVHNQATPLEFEISRGSDVESLQKLLANYLFQ